MNEDTLISKTPTPEYRRVRQIINGRETREVLQQKFIVQSIEWQDIPVLEKEITPADLGLKPEDIQVSIIGDHTIKPRDVKMFHASTKEEFLKQIEEFKYEQAKTQPNHH